MTWEDIASLSESGYDIQSHGASHKDLTTVSAADLEYEVGGSRQSLLEHGYNSTIFGPAFANDEGNSTIINTISKYYDMARVGYAPLRSYTLILQIDSLFLYGLIMIYSWYTGIIALGYSMFLSKLLIVKHNTTLTVR